MPLRKVVSIMLALMILLDAEPMYISLGCKQSQFYTVMDICLHTASE